MSVPAKVVELIHRFQENAIAYRSGHYNETQLRRQFIDPFFKALGWDIDNEQGVSETYKDVIHEYALKIGSSTKAPDYCFRLGKDRKFFVEAKKPSVNLKDDITPAYQLRRYGWSASLPVSILTDFEEFAVYDCRIQPVKTDKAFTARILYLEYSEYTNRWDEIYSIFSREAVLDGSLNQYTESIKAKKGTATVDAAFLKEIESWRERLALNLALRNPELKQRELNFAVQMTINRLIFLRISEDRGIEPYGRLMELQNTTGVYEELVQLFRQADDRYKSGLFSFKQEKDRPELPDELTLNLTIDDESLKQILKSFYYPDSPYEFSVIPIEILGQVYEQFLGKVIRLTPDHHVVVEDKPEVRKAGGVYYTPTYIVDYIVKNTVGKLLEGKTPKQAAKLKIIDPACGSGCFLIGAYQYLLDWYRARYIATGTQKHKKQLYQASSGEWQLTSDEKKRILLNNIYGVDIDPQAVETTKLSLLLNVLEGESQETVFKQLQLFQERALPKLGNNIKCGNSLIDSHFYDHVQLSLLDEEEHYRINIFDWASEFTEITQSGGFDAVIGNPPYIRIQALKEWAPLEVEFYKQGYTAASKGNYDIYGVFVEKGLSLLNSRGRLGFILPYKFFNAQYGQPLRELLAKGKNLAKVVHFGDEQVFSGATTYTCLLFLEKVGSSQCQFVKVDDLNAWRTTGKASDDIIYAANITAANWNFSVGKEAALFEKLSRMTVKFEDVAARIAQGIRTSANPVYVLDLVSDKGDLIIAHSKQLNREVELERKAVFLFLQGREIKPYQILPSGKVVIIPYSRENERTKLISETEFSTSFPKTFAYLVENQDFLESRERGRMRGVNWYAYVYPKNIDLMKARKILIPDIADRASFALDEAGEYAFTSGYGITLKSSVGEPLKYVLGLLNSNILDFYWKKVSTCIRGNFFRYFTQFVEQLPIRSINFANPSDKVRCDHMVEMVEQMLSLHKGLTAAKTVQDNTRIQRQIEATDKQINQLVYELYELTDEEIQIVEKTTR
jgi:hypothetical protein